MPKSKNKDLARTRNWQIFKTKGAFSLLRDISNKVKGLGGYNHTFAEIEKIFLMSIDQDWKERKDGQTS